MMIFEYFGYLAVKLLLLALLRGFLGWGNRRVGNLKVSERYFYVLCGAGTFVILFLKKLKFFANL